MDNRLYKIIAHPRTLERVFLEFEIVNSTPRHYDIQPRSIPNKHATGNTRRIKKDHVCNGSSISTYYWTKAQAVDMERKRWEHKIRVAERDIEDAQREIAALDAFAASYGKSDA